MITLSSVTFSVCCCIGCPHYNSFNAFAYMLHVHHPGGNQTGLTRAPLRVFSNPFCARKLRGHEKQKHTRSCMTPILNPRLCCRFGIPAARSSVGQGIADDHKLAQGARRNAPVAHAREATVAHEASWAVSLQPPVRRQLGRPCHGGDRSQLRCDQICPASTTATLSVNRAQNYFPVPRICIKAFGGLNSFWTAYRGASARVPRAVPVQCASCPL